MKSRAELEEILAAQRANRRTLSPVPTLRKRGRDLLGVLAVIIILVASGAAMFFAMQWTTPAPARTETTSPSVSPLTSTSTNISPTFMATPVAMKVCTNIPDGRLHVRFSAGDGSEVRGYLTEGEAVQIALDPNSELDSQIIKGNLWVRISFPVAGWVNARYLCKSE
ncbi:MAG: hypothetical protein KJZ72_21040 [Anaerolineales bacterium]|nr:hypothetical protein [Anaerolineales bacterium]